jgi:hypothetical protein
MMNDTAQRACSSASALAAALLSLVAGLPATAGAATANAAASSLESPSETPVSAAPTTTTPAAETSSPLRSRERVPPEPARRTPAPAARSGASGTSAAPSSPGSGTGTAPGAAPNAAPMRSWTLGRDFFASGERVELPAEVAGDALIATQDLSPGGSVAGDLVAVAERATVSESVGHTLYLIAGQATLRGMISGNARVAADDLSVTSAGHIAGGASLAARHLQFEGDTGSYLAVVADDANVDGHVAGDLLFIGRHLQLGPHARIDGAVRYSASSPPDISPGAQVTGGTHRFILPEGAYGYDSDALLRIGWWLWLLGWLLVGAVALGLWPLFTLSVSAALRARSGLCLLLGLTVAILTPLVATLLVLSVLGIPLGLLLVLMYLLVLPLGYLSAATAIGDWLLLHLHRSPLRSNASAWRLLALTPILIGLHLLANVPVFGALIELLVMLVGVGALLLTLGVQRRGPTGAMP